MAINFNSFIQTDEWQKLVQTLLQMEKDYVDQIVAAGEEGNVSKVMNLTGRIAVIKEVITLPEYLYSTERLNKEEERKGQQDGRDV